jgi:hypothetical protein
MRKPDFIHIGAMKCGTHSFMHGINTHEDIFCAHGQRFLHSDEWYDEKGLQQYLATFSDREEESVGEVSGFYAWDSWCEETAERIGRDVPNANIFYLIRHPIQRIESHWAWAIADGRPWGMINEAVCEVDRLIEMSLYWRQLSRYREHFDEDQIKVLFLEDLKADPRSFFLRMRPVSWCGPERV